MFNCHLLVPLFKYAPSSTPAPQTTVQTCNNSPKRWQHPIQQSSVCVCQPTCNARGSSFPPRPEYLKHNIINDPAHLFFKFNYFLPIIIAGTAIPATRAMPTGAPINVPNCHSSFFFLDQGFFPQNVHPDGLEENRVVVNNQLPTNEKPKSYLR